MSDTATTVETSPDVMPPSNFMSDMVKSLETNMAQVLNPAPKADKVVADVKVAPDTSKVDKAADTKVADTAKADTKVVIDDAPDNLSEKGKENWKSLKAAKLDFENKFKGSEEKLTKLLADFEELKKTATQPKADNGEVDSLRKQLEEYSTIVRQLNVENHPKFKAHFENRTNQALELAKAAVGPTQSEKAMAIMKMADGSEKDSALDMFIDELPRHRQSLFGAALAEFDKVKLERVSAIRQETDNYARTQAEMTAKQQEQQQVSVKQRDEILAKSKETALSMEGFKTIEGNEEHNKSVATRVKFIDDFFHGRVDPKLIPTIPALIGDYTDVMNRRMPALQSENTKLKEQLQAFQAGNPNPGGGGGSKAPEDSGKLEAGPDFVKNLVRMMGK